jgi:hypothetical protein
VRRQQFNGLDYLEVGDDQTELTVYFLGPAPDDLSAANVRVTGGRRIRDIRVLAVEVCPSHDPELDTCMVVTVDRPGDFSTYTLCLVDLPDEAAFDPRYRCLDFTFKAGCPTDLDCETEPVCPPETHAEPEISYLAKDYASFRRLILDRLSVVMPDWNERHVPDLGITLVELLAYVGDHLSYHQDAVATEAYLDTARQRISVRRHARLVDYHVHEGCNARTWVHVHTSTDVTLPLAELAFLTRFDNAPDVEGRLLTWQDLAGVPSTRFEVFEPLAAGPEIERTFRTAHNEIFVYTWGNAECCLPRGAMSATLVDGPSAPVDGGNTEVDVASGGDAEDAAEGGSGGPNDDEHDDAGDAGGYDEDGDAGDEGPSRVLDLAPGDVLIFEEVIGPRTGVPEDADPARRHAVRLTRVEPIVDALYGQPLLEVAWSEEDALPFPLCVSVIGPAPACELIENVSVARANVVLVDHGRRLDAPEGLGCVPVAPSDLGCEAEGQPSERVHQADTFRPYLAEPRLTFSEPVTSDGPAASQLDQDPRAAVPGIRLTSRPDPECDTIPAPGGAGDDAADDADDADDNSDEAPRAWTARRDLLASGPEDWHYVVEMDDRRRAHLRFGDGELGRRPAPGSRFQARYRVGNGPAGNVGADALVLAVAHQPVDGVTLRPRNPLPARGGTAPEPVRQVKLFAPHAFRRQIERAVTAEDYARLAERHEGVQRAAAELRWNGSWYEARVAVDPLGEAEADAALLSEIEGHLYRYRRIGHDLAVRPATYVPLDIVLEVCVEPGFLRGHVKAALLQRFGAHCLPSGARAFFHPDEHTFGEGIALSRLVAAAQDVAGVRSVTVRRLERLFEGPAGEIESGLLPIGTLEIARLENDPDFPEHGRVTFELRGGR